MERYNVTRKKNGQYKDVKKVSNRRTKNRDRIDDDGFTDQRGIKNLSLFKRIKRCF